MACSPSSAAAGLVQISKDAHSQTAATRCQIILGANDFRANDLRTNVPIRIYRTCPIASAPLEPPQASHLRKRNLCSRSQKERQAGSGLDAQGHSIGWAGRGCPEATKTLNIATHYRARFSTRSYSYRIQLRNEGRLHNGRIVATLAASVAGGPGEGRGAMMMAGGRWFRPGHWRHNLAGQRDREACRQQ